LRLQKCDVKPGISEDLSKSAKSGFSKAKASDHKILWQIFHLTGEMLWKLNNKPLRLLGFPDIQKLLRDWTITPPKR
jgi:hypothetical protein